MNNIKTMPRLIFFRWIKDDLPQYIQLHLKQQVDCLSQFFDVMLINEAACNYDEICDRYEPDLTLFESSTYSTKRNIKNITSHPQIPKLGFFNSDAYCSTRTSFLSDMENWGIETYFAISVSLGEYTPSIADNLFTWPNFIDSKLYRDYGEKKTIPILFTGSKAIHYPWRNRIYDVIIQYYPTLICPHFGWFSGQQTSRMIHGESYARMLNASWIAPTCGTIAKEVVRKHFEIPGTKTCLVTESSCSLIAAGFIDMKNCVFADETTILDKLDYLFRNPDILKSIIQAGYNLVHSQHTQTQRNQIYQWYTLNKSLKPNQHIVQNGPFEHLIVVEALEKKVNRHVISCGIDRKLLQEGDICLRKGEYDRAGRKYIQCLNYHFMPEANLKLVLCNLYQGNSTIALQWITQSISRTLTKHFAPDPDPVEWAYFIIALLCHGFLDQAISRAYQFPYLRHNELDRTRKIINFLNNKDSATRWSSDQKNKYRPSVHQFPDQTLEQWIVEVCKMLRACKQNLLENLLLIYLAELKGLKIPFYSKWLVWTSRTVYKKIAKKDDQLLFPLYKNNRYSWFRNNIFSKIKSAFHKLSFFQKENRGDDLLQLINNLSRKEAIKSVLVLGTTGWTIYKENFLLGLQNNPCIEMVFFKIPNRNLLNKCSIKMNKKYWKIEFCDESIYQIKQNNLVNKFELVFIDGVNGHILSEYNQIEGADAILIIGVNEYHAHIFQTQLLASGIYTLIYQNILHSFGFTLFRKI